MKIIQNLNFSVHKSILLEYSNTHSFHIVYVHTGRVKRLQQRQVWPTKHLLFIILSFTEKSLWPLVSVKGLIKKEWNSPLIR